MRFRNAGVTLKFHVLVARPKEILVLTVDRYDENCGGAF